MGFDFKIKKGSLADLLDELEDEVESISEAMVFALAADLAGLIRNRVSQGLGSDDRPMLSPSKESMGAYSRDYAKYRREKGRTTDSRDLAFTGRMMAGITVDGPYREGSDLVARVVFAGGAEIQLKAVYNEQMTPFFGISPKDQKVLERAAEAYLQQFLNNEGNNAKRKSRKN